MATFFLDVTHLLLSADYYFNDGFSFITLFPLGIVKVAITADADWTMVFMGYIAYMYSTQI